MTMTETCSVTTATGAIPVLLYHSVSDAPAGRFGPFTVSRSQLAAHLGEHPHVGLRDAHCPQVAQRAATLQAFLTEPLGVGKGQSVGPNRVGHRAELGHPERTPLEARAALPSPPRPP